MRELDLLTQYLIKLRQEKLERGHLLALNTDTEQDLVHVRVCAYEAELCDRLRESLKILAEDPGRFIEKYLKRGRDD